MPNHYIPRVVLPCAVCGTLVERERRTVGAWNGVACSRHCAGKLRGMRNVGLRHTTADRVIHDGYVRVRHPVTGKWIREHRLVVEQEIGRPLDRAELVHHENEIKTDNALGNLDITTFSEHSSHHNRGERSGNARLTESSVRAIRQRAAAGERQYRLCAEFGISRAHMCSIIKRRYWKHI